MRYILVLALAVLILLPVGVRASSDDVQAPPPIIQEAQAIREEVREEIEEIREEAREAIEETRAESVNVAPSPRAAVPVPRPVAPATVDREAARKTYAAERTAAREVLRDERDAVRMELAAQRSALKERIAAKREDLRERLEKVRDERKRKTVTRIDLRIDAANANVVVALTVTTDQLVHVLDRIASRAAKAEANDVDTAAVERQVATARAAITAARSAIAEQAGRTYDLLIGSEETLRSDVARTRQTAKADLSAVRAQIQSARDAVARATASLKEIPHIDTLTVDVQAE